MNGTDSTGQAPQFQTVEYEVKSGTCVLCNQPIAGMYYRINGHQACANCAERERTAQSQSAKYYTRALIFGIGAAIVGMIGYATFEIVSGWTIGYLSLAVGWLIGKAMLKGSNGMGGRKYQITAVLLTYAAVSMAFVPVVMSQMSKQKALHNQAQVQQPTQQTPSTPSSSAPATPETTDQAAEVGAAGAAGSSVTVKADGSIETKPAEQTKPAMSPGKAFANVAKGLAILIGVGLASPFLELADPLHGLIGLVILFVGMQIAWKMMARPKLVIDGPF